MLLKNRTFIVSGGSSGLGFGTVQELLKAGAYVSILDKKQPPATDGSRVLFVQMNITQIPEIQDAVDRTVAWTQETGAVLGGVINCAGIGKPTTTVNTKGDIHPPELWDETIAVNLSGTFHLSRLAAKHLISVPREEGPDGERGVILMVSSTVASEGVVGQVAYAASKGAIESMTLPMARDMSRFAIRVVTIIPGLFATRLTEQFSTKMSTKIHSKALLFPKRFGQPAEFASTVRWILENVYVNAENIKLTGGIRVPACL